MRRGKLIVFEGIDGSGKLTQAKLLVRRLKREGFKAAAVDFPRYGNLSASFVEAYLRGEFGKATAVKPEVASLFYALDRYAASFSLRRLLSKGVILVADRYTSSNIGHQGGKLIKNPARWRAYIRWIDTLEYVMLGIPRPDQIFLLQTDPSFSRRTAQQRSHAKERNVEHSVKKGKDIHEKDIAHLRAAAASYRRFAREFPRGVRAITVAESGKFLSKEKIHEMIWKEVRRLVR